MSGVVSRDISESTAISPSGGVAGVLGSSSGVFVLPSPRVTEESVSLLVALPVADSVSVELQLARSARERAVVSHNIFFFIFIFPFGCNIIFILVREDTS